MILFTSSFHITSLNIFFYASHLLHSALPSILYHWKTDFLLLKSLIISFSKHSPYILNIILHNEVEFAAEPCWCNNNILRILRSFLSFLIQLIYCINIRAASFCYIKALDWIAITYVPVIVNKSLLCSMCVYAWDFSMSFLSLIPKRNFLFNILIK